MSFFLQFQNITFVYEQAAERLFEEVSFQADAGWTGVVGANGAGKTTLLKLATGLLLPSEGRVLRPERTIYCAQRTDDPPRLFEAFLSDYSGSAQLLKGRMGITTDWLDRWPTLSHGERKRAQIATALWQEPDLLAVDEPTNHLDLDARKLVADALARFAGVGLLVSHDRMLLDSLCGQCLFVEPPQAEARPGGFTEASASAAREQLSLQRQKEIRKKEYRRLDREFKRRKEGAGREKNRISKRGLAKHDHDAREKRDRARVSGKDAADSRRQRQLKGRLDQADRRVKNLRVRKEAILGIWFEGIAVSRDRLLDLPAGQLLLGDEKRLVHPELVIQPADRIALSGPNGSGKSTLVRKIVQSLQAPRESILYMPQEMDIEESVSLLDEVRRLSPDRLGELMAIVSHLGSRPDRLLTTQLPSPGEVRKLFLALGILNRPQIILMDEPTNHMDLPSTLCLEKALAQCPCGYLLVSHDMTFLQSLTKRAWEIRADHDAQGQPNTYFLQER